MTSRRALGVDLLLIAALKALVGAWALHKGFSHVSDDDYARVVLAQSFAHAPNLDPTGTSWLPFPFWLTGTAMVAFGRTLATARAVAIASGIAGALCVYVAARAAFVRRPVALASVIVAMCTPWSAWLGVATVPEALTGALIAASAIAIGSARARPYAALALTCAALSRYEAWPACAVLAVVAIVAAQKRAKDGARPAALREVGVAIVAASGPLVWMAWNAHAHGSATHFLARVAAYRQAIGAAQLPYLDKVVGYPRALFASASDTVLLGAVGLLGLGDPAVRKRWALPMLTMAAMLAFLVYGDVRDGAPTHHPERALTAMYWVLAAFGIDGAAAFARKVAWARPAREMVVVGTAAACAVAWLAGVVRSFDAPPGRDPEERREAQIARGAALRARGVPAFVVTPCAYEHYALLAAYGAPERARVITAPRRAVDATCPIVEEPSSEGPTIGPLTR